MRKISNFFKLIYLKNINKNYIIDYYFIKKMTIFDSGFVVFVVVFSVYPKRLVLGIAISWWSEKSLNISIERGINDGVEKLGCAYKGPQLKMHVFQMRARNAALVE